MSPWRISIVVLSVLALLSAMGAAVPGDGVSYAAAGSDAVAEDESLREAVVTCLDFVLDSVSEVVTVAQETLECTIELRAGDFFFLSVRRPQESPLFLNTPALV